MAIPSPRFPLDYSDLPMVPSELPTGVPPRSGAPASAPQMFGSEAMMPQNMQSQRFVSPPVLNPIMVPSPRFPMDYSDLPMVPSELTYAAYAPQTPPQSACGAGWHVPQSCGMPLPSGNPFATRQHLVHQQHAPMMHGMGVRSSVVDLDSDASSPGSSSSDESSEASLEETSHVRVVEKLVYVDRPVYMDRIVQVPVYVDRNTSSPVDKNGSWPVTVRTVRADFREPRHDFPYHNPLVEEGCGFIGNYLPAATEIFAY